LLKGYRLYRNNTNNNNWLEVSLHGIVNKTAVGGKVYVYEHGHIGDAGYLKGYREVCISNQYDKVLRQHFGLNSASTYDVRAVFNTGAGTVVDTLGVATGRILNIYEDSTVTVKRQATMVMAGEKSLYAYPNPFAAGTVVRLTGLLPSSHTDVGIFDVRGKQVVRLHVTGRQLNAGISWDGRDRQGNKVRSGVYFCRLQKGSVTLENKMIIMQ
jgi:hypothetical protein